MSDTPLVTVILPMFDAADTVVAAARSVLAEPIGALELLVIDDGSTDDGAARLRALNDPRIRIVAQDNAGLVAALNRGLDEATGEYLARMDADDLSVPGRIAAQVAWLRAHPRAVVCGTGYEYFGAVTGRVRPPRSDAACRQRLRLSTCCCGASIVLPRRVVEEAGLRFDADYPHAEDYEFLSRLAGLGEIGNLPVVGYRYRIHDGQVSSRHGAAQRASHLAVADAYAARSGYRRVDPASLGALLWPDADGSVATAARSIGATRIVCRAPRPPIARLAGRKAIDAVLAVRRPG